MKKHILLLFLTVQFICAAAQEVVLSDKLNIPSANVSALKSYGDIPVTAFTGMPQISIPIYSVALNYLNFPIYLTNNPSGFKPESHPSWVGMGWNLSVGGVITREVKSYKDEIFTTSTTYGGKNGLGFYYSYRILDNNDWHTVKNPNTKPSEFPSHTYNSIDRAPDIFSFNFLGYSGKFFLNHKGEWKVQSDNQIKVIFEEKDLTCINENLAHDNCFSKFTLIDEKGIKYIFGGKNAVEFSSSIIPYEYNYLEGWTATSWQLKEIQTPDGQKIILNYEVGPFQSSFSYTVWPSVILKKGVGSDSYKASNYVFMAGFSEIEHKYLAPIFSGSIISPVYLTSISIPTENLTISFNTSKSNELSYSEGTYTDRYFYGDNVPNVVNPKFLNFSATTGIPYFERNPKEGNEIMYSGNFKNRFIWLKLDEIKFKYKDKEAQSLKLYYRENPEKRLRLDSISTIYPEVTQRETYSFEYHPDLLPPNNIEYEYLSEYCDHWGFSNLKFLWNKNEIGVKAPLRERAKFGVLSKIIYPTKGYTQFFYENHDYSKKIEYTNNVLTALTEYCGSSNLAGGLRIKKIIDVDGFGKYNSKEYLYTKNYGNNELISSGTLRSLPIYNIGSGDLFSSNGIYISYSHVIEKYEDGSFKAVTFSAEDITYRLGNSTTTIVDDTPVNGGQVWGGYIPHSSRDFERGKILDEYYCDSIGKIINSKHYYYSNINRDASNFIRSVDPDWNRRFYVGYNMTNGMIGNGLSSTSYYYYTYQNKLTSIKDVEYGPDSNLIYYYNAGLTSSTALIKEQSFEYDKYGQIINTTNFGSDGKQYKTVTQYSYTNNPTSGILYDMVNRNMLSYPIEQKKYMNNTLLKGIAYSYSNFAGDILLSKVEDINANNIKLLQYQNTKYNTGRLIERVYNSGLIESYLWSETGRKPMAVIQNISIDNLNKILPNGYTDKGLLSSNYINELATLRNQVAGNVYINSYDYSNDGSLKQETTSNDISTYYDYGANRRLSAIKNNDKNILQSFIYNYGNKQGHIYYNDELTVSAGKICPDGYMSNKAVSVKVLAGEFSSTTSKEDANNKARIAHEEEMHILAEKSCVCIRYGSYNFEQINSFQCQYELQNVYASYYADEIQMNHLSIRWTLINTDDYAWYNPSSEGITIGRISGGPLPTATKYINYLATGENKTGGYGNNWIISIDKSGYIRIKMKDPSKDNIPKVGESISIGFTVNIY